MTRRERLDDKPEDEILNTLMHREDAAELIERRRAELREGFAELQLQYPNAPFEELMNMYVQENPEVFNEFKEFVTKTFRETGSFEIRRSPVHED